jgi:hypothetical protein
VPEIRPTSVPRPSRAADQDLARAGSASVPAASTSPTMPSTLVGRRSSAVTRAASQVGEAGFPCDAARRPFSGGTVVELISR